MTERDKVCMKAVELILKQRCYNFKNFRLFEYYKKCLPMTKGFFEIIFF